MWTYSCPECGEDIEAERFKTNRITCPSCGAGPYDTEHDCNYDGEDTHCEDYLVPAADKA